MNVHVLGFGLAVLPLILTPGLSFTLATQRTLAGESGVSLRVALGTDAGIVVQALLAGLGLVALLQQWPQGLDVLRLGGALYLLWPGARMLYAVWYRGSGRSRRNTDRATSARPAQSEALWGTLLNAKAASVYLLIAPQFVGREVLAAPAFLLLAAVHVVLMTAWLTGWCALLGRVSQAVPTPNLSLWTGGLGGLVLVTLAIRSLLA